MSETTVAIFRTTRDEWRELRAIRLEALADTPAAFGTTYAEALQWSDDHWRQLASLHVFFLANCEGRAVGMASGGTFEGVPGTKWLYALYVTPTMRGSAVATDLVSAVGQWAREEGAEALYLMVRSTVQRARAFYEKVGFRPAVGIALPALDSSMAMTTMVRDLD